MLVLVVRSLVLYLIVVIVMRIMGKRQIGELQPYELATAIMVSELAAIPMQDIGIPLINGIVPILILLIGQIIISFISLKSNKGRALICGTPTILIENGRLNEHNLRKELYNINDLLEQLRINNVPNISDVEYAILETSGQLSVIPKSQKRAATPEDLKIKTNYEGLPINLIIDGGMLIENVKKAGKDIEWLEHEIKKRKIENTKDVLFASIDSNGKLYCQEKINERKQNE